jgi:hypothetical protein
MVQPDSSAVEARRKQHEAITAEVEKRLVANADNFDKAVLTYSSAGLALSLGFLKDFVPIHEATCSWLLYASWGFFLMAVIVTMLSYLTSQLAQRKNLAISRKYNLELKDEALNETNWPGLMTESASYVAGACFVMALLGSTLFVSINLPKGSKMADPIRGIAHDGAPAPIIQSMHGDLAQKGAPAPIIQSVPLTQPASSSPAPSPATAPAPAPVSNR